MNFLKPHRATSTAMIVTSQQLPVPAAPTPNPVEALTGIIKDEYAELQHGAAANAARAIKIGEMLLELKVLFKSRKVGGHFTDYVKIELGIQERLAQRWMAKARQKAKLSQALGFEPTDCRVFDEAD